MRPTECPECDKTIEATDLKCNNCGTEIEDSKCNYCEESLDEYDESLGRGTELFLCYHCYLSAANEMGDTDTAESLERDRDLYLAIKSSGDTDTA